LSKGFDKAQKVVSFIYWNTKRYAFIVANTTEQGRKAKETMTVLGNGSICGSPPFLVLSFERNSLLWWFGLPFFLPLTVSYCCDGTEEETGSDPKEWVN